MLGSQIGGLIKEIQCRGRFFGRVDDSSISFLQSKVPPKREREKIGVEEAIVICMVVVLGVVLQDDFPGMLK